MLYKLFSFSSFKIVYDLYGFSISYFNLIANLTLQSPT